MCFKCIQNHETFFLLVGGLFMGLEIYKLAKAFFQNPRLPRLVFDEEEDIEDEDNAPDDLLFNEDDESKSKHEKSAKKKRPLKS